jgi:hypothetical protein
MVLATSLAAHGSGAAVADGMTGDDTAIATTAAPPTAEAANVATRPRRNTAVIDLITHSLRFANVWVLRKRTRIGGNRSPGTKRAKGTTKTAETTTAHIAISTAWLVNSASEYTRQWQESVSRR